MDMAAVYMKQRWPGTLSESVLAMAEVVPRPQEYDQSNTGFMAWFVFHIFRAWIRGLTLSKTKRG